MNSKNNQSKRWEVPAKLKVKGQKLEVDDIVNILLENRGIKTKKEKEEFLHPTQPLKLSLKSVGIKEKEIKKAIARIKKALKEKERVVIYGDYDADGICGTAILWETLYGLGLDVLPYLPERFSEGYGIKANSVGKLLSENEKLSLIITVDNGIVARKEIEKIKKLGIDVIVTDHHLPGKKHVGSLATIHTTKISGSAVAWILAREIIKKFKNNEAPQANASGIFSARFVGAKSAEAESASHSPRFNRGSAKADKKKKSDGLDLVTIGTVADQLPLVGLNRSFVKFGLEALNKTKRPGLLALFEEAKVVVGKIGVYEIGFILAPRINAMGRLVHAIDSLRLLCTKNKKKAYELAGLLGRTNLERQRVVDEVLLKAKETLNKNPSQKMIILAHESYHEGVIGLAAGKLAEEFYRPTIVISKSQNIAKASARSIPGFNLIEVIRKTQNFILEGGGHPMAAGFSLETNKIQEFSQEIRKISAPFLTEEILTKKLKVDLCIQFDLLNQSLFFKLKVLEPTGYGNPTPLFLTLDVEVKEARLVGSGRQHLKLVLTNKNKTMEAIGFGLGAFYPSLSPTKKVDVVYSLDENIWNGQKRFQLKLRDLKPKGND